MHNAIIFNSTPLTPRKRFTKPSLGVEYATDENSDPIYASEYSKDKWVARGKDGLNCMLCVQEERDISAVGFVKHSNTPHFRHKTATEHSYETQWHFESKMLLKRILESSGAQVEVEKSLNKGASRADVYAETGSQGFAFEVQYSGQELELYHRRTQKYVDSGKRCQWLYHPECDVINIGREVELRDLVLSDDKKQIGFIVFRDYSNAIWLPWIHRSEVEFKHVVYTDIEDWHLSENGLEPIPETKAHDMLLWLQNASRELHAAAERRRVTQAEAEARREREKEEKRLAWAERVQNQERDQGYSDWELKEREMNLRAEKIARNPSHSLFSGKVNPEPRLFNDRYFARSDGSMAYMHLPERKPWKQRSYVRLASLLECKELLEWLSDQQYFYEQHYQISMLVGYMYWPKHEHAVTRDRALSLILGEREERIPDIMKDFYSASSIWEPDTMERITNRTKIGTFWSVLKMDELSNDASFPHKEVRKPMLEDIQPTSLTQEPLF